MITKSMDFFMMLSLSLCIVGCSAAVVGVAKLRGELLVLWKYVEVWTPDHKNRDIFKSSPVEYSDEKETDEGRLIALSAGREERKDEQSC